MLFLSYLLTSYWLIFNQSQAQVHFFSLWQNLNYFRKAFFKRSHKSFAFGLIVKSIYLIMFPQLTIYGIVSEQSTRIRSLQADFEKTLNEKNQVFFKSVDIFVSARVVVSSKLL